MLNINKQIKDNTTKAIENAQTFLSLSFENVSKITNKNIEMSKQMIEDSVKTAKVFANTQTPQEFANNLRNLTASNIEKATNSYREFYEAMNSSKEKMNEFFTKNYKAYSTQTESINQWISKYSSDKLSSVNSTVDNVVKHTDEAMDAVKAMSTQTQKAVKENIEKTAKIVEEVVENTKAVVTKNTETVINSAKEFGNTVAKATEHNAKLAANKVVEAVKQASNVTNHINTK